MGASLAGLLIMSVFLTSAIVMWRVDLFSKVFVANAASAAIEHDGDQARTSIDITGAGGDVTDGMLTAYVKNVGSTSIAETDFPDMDFIVIYDLSTRAPPGLHLYGVGSARPG